MALLASAPRAAPGPVVSLSVLGAVSVAVAGRDIKIKSRKSGAVLAYVVLNEALRETRERLVGLLWSESEEEKARGSLRQTLRELRVLFIEAGYQGFRTDKLAVEFDRGSIDVDLWAVLRDAEAGRAHPLLLDRPRLVEALLDGFDDLDPSFRVWLLAKREAINNRLLRALETALRNESVDADARGKLAVAVINLDPTHEEACRLLMRAKAEAGDTSGALRVYKTLWDLLDADYDMEPAAATQRLVADIKTGTFEQAAPTAPAARPGPAVVDAGHEPFSGKPPATAPIARQPAAKIELALDPFDMNEVQPDKLHLVQGFRQHLIASLVRFREWYVTDRSAQFPAGASQLAVSARYAVQAAAYQTGTIVNLILTLRQDDTNHYIWSDQFELSLGNWFETQQRIVRRLTMALNVNLSTERLMRLAGQPDVSLDIHDLWLRGQSAVLSFDPARRRQASEAFAEIIRAAPNFSPAYSSLAQLINTEHVAYPGLFRDPDKERQTLELARNAVQLDPVDSRAHLCMAWSYAMSKQYEHAVEHADLASQLNEIDSWTMFSAAHILAYCASFQRAKELSKRAFDISPMPNRTHWDYVAKNRFLWGDYEGCLAATSQSQDMLVALPAWASSAHFHAGHRNEAAHEAQRFLAIIRSKWFGPLPATDETIVRWFLHQYPISRREDWERLRDGLGGAGLPVGGLDHHAW
jgi:DNA-binding SARP family transcriptional activator/TolB-like protein